LRPNYRDKAEARFEADAEENKHLRGAKMFVVMTRSRSRSGRKAREASAFDNSAGERTVSLPIFSHAEIM
jgi:hypothetical protein